MLISPTIDCGRMRVRGAPIECTFSEFVNSDANDGGENATITKANVVLYNALSETRGP